MIKTNTFFILLVILLGACKGEVIHTEKPHDIIDKERTIQFLDSINYVLNKPNLKKGFKLYYNCDSVAFMKRVIGDTIEIYRKGGYTPLYYSSIYEFSSFKHYIENYDSTDVSYLSKFYEDGRIILEQPTHYILIIKNDSLFNYYVDDFQYIDEAIDLDLKVLYNEITQKEANAKKQELRHKYSPKETFDFIFHKDLFSDSKNIKLDKSINSSYSFITLSNQWIYDNKKCYTIVLSDTTEEYIRTQSFTFNENYQFIEDENCNK